MAHYDIGFSQFEFEMLVLIRIEEVARCESMMPVPVNAIFHVNWSCFRTPIALNKYLRCVIKSLFPFGVRLPGNLNSLVKIGNRFTSCFLLLVFSNTEYYEPSRRRSQPCHF
jgi:hypothetical protein